MILKERPASVVWEWRRRGLDTKLRAFEALETAASCCY